MSESNFNPVLNDGIPELSVAQVKEISEKDPSVQLIDVRRPDEFNGELGHMKGAQLVTLGPELTQFLKTGDKGKKIVFICRSGARSGQATLDSLALGYKFVANMTGGMLKWNEGKFPTEKA